MKFFTGMVRSALIMSLTLQSMPCWANSTNNGVNEYLDMDITQLMQVTITSVSKREQSLSDAAAAIYVISQDDIRRSGVTSIPEALRMAPGLQVARLNSNNWAVTSRGLANGQFSNKLLVLIDGRTAYTPSFSGTYWDMQTTLLEDIDRIEVIRGPGATVWGANAVNGVINIITKKSAETQGGIVSVATGNVDEIQGGIRYGASLNTSTDGRAYITYSKRDSFDLLLDGSDANDNWDSLAGGFRLDGELAQKSTWTLQGDIYSNDENQSIAPYLTRTPPFISQNRSELDAKGWNILGRYERSLTNGAFKFQAYFDYFNRDESIAEQTFKTTDFELQYERQLYGIHDLTFGLGYRNIDASAGVSFTLSADPSSRNDHLYSGFIQDTITLVEEELWFTLGTKWEHNEFTGNELQPSGRLMWQPTEKQSVWGSISRAVRTPSIIERTGNIKVGFNPSLLPATPFISVAANNQFDSEELIAYEAGYRWSPVDNLFFDFAVFYNDYEELLGGQPAPTPTNPAQGQFANNVEGNTYGVEVVAEWNAEQWLGFTFVYSYLHLDFDGSSILGDNAQAIILESNAPQHQASLRTNIDFLNDWQANIWLRYVSELDAASGVAQMFGIEVDAYMECDINLSWRPTENFELIAAGQNLLDSSHLEFVSALFTPPAEVERSFYLKAKYKF